MPAISVRLWLRVALLVLVTLAAPAGAGEAVLYERPSLFGSIIVTEDENGLRILRFERYGARQSVVKPGDPEYLELPYAQVAMVGLALCEEPRRFLVVGLGGGTLPMFLRKHYPHAAIDAVDIDPQIVQVAKQFFSFREDDLLRAHVGDGRQFIEKAREQYDAIFLDAYGAEAVPAHLTTQEFLQAVRRAVKPGGVVVGNIWARGSNPLYDSMVRTYQEVFDELFILAVRGTGNRILIALPRRQPLTREALAQLARGVSSTKKFRFDLGDLVTNGYSRAREKNRDGHVLRDAVPGRPQ